MKKQSYISSDPEIMGGIPVIAGTRVPVSQILFLLKSGYALPQIHDMYRHVSVATLQKVIDEIDKKLPDLTNGQAFLQT
ncbi:DUF433 domain-containing protein [Candidatus Daviesbacteria bacterium]|nr:DUF433 domain-containing protein [Candidatus Daviesbacteria bacterium]